MLGSGICGPSYTQGMKGVCIMARYGAPLMTDVIRGKIGGVVFTKAKSGPTIRVRVKPSNPGTARQTAVRAAMTNAAREYKGLASVDVAAWNTYAAGLSWSNGVGGSFHPSGINAYTSLATVFLAITPAGTPPVLPPASPFAGDTIAVAGAGGAGDVTFTASGANAAGVYTEIDIAPLPSPNRVAKPSDYRIEEYHHYVGGALVRTIAKAPGYYSLAYRFVLSTTGERGPLVVLGTFQVT